MKKQTFLTVYRHSKLKFRYDFELEKKSGLKKIQFFGILCQIYNELMPYMLLIILIVNN